MNIQKLEKYFYNFKTAIERQDYYQAHEILEEIWFPQRFNQEEIEVKLLKAFINASVSFELIKKGKKEQSKKVWKNYLKYRPLLLKNYPNKNKYYQLSRYIDKKAKEILK